MTTAIQPITPRAAETAVVELRGATRIYKAPRRGLLPSRRTIRALFDVDVSIAERQTTAVVGESGCGKTTLARLVLGLEEPDAGEVRFRDRPLSTFGRSAKRDFRRSVQAVFQDPYGSLSPRMRAWEIIMEPALVNTSVSTQDAQTRAGELLELVGLSAEAATRFPHQFSGGQRQRIAVARALSVQPELIVLDEPVSALDVSVRAQTLNLLNDLKASFDMAFLFISHDLAVVAHFADYVYVMYLGQVVESGPVFEVFDEPKHPYTRALLASVPRGIHDFGTGISETGLLRGEIASADNIPSGCSFHTRCPLARDRCAQAEPPLETIEDGTSVACFAYPEWPD